MVDHKQWVVIIEVIGGYYLYYTTPYYLYGCDELADEDINENATNLITAEVEVYEITN